MKMEGGFNWPDHDTVTPRVVLAEIRRLPLYLAHLPADRRRVCVQAGGNVGIYPVALSKHFQQVFTFEPDAANWECLKANVKRANIFAMRGAVSNQPGSVTTWRTPREAANYGATRIRTTTEPGAVPAYKIDDQVGRMGEGLVDFIMLDVEGCEQPALEGAARIIEMNHPLISVELKGLGEPLGWPDQFTKDWLAARGYAQVAKIGNDWLFQWTRS